MLRRFMIGLMLVTFSLTGCATIQNTQTEKKEPEKQMSESKDNYTQAVIETNKGTIVFEFFPDAAPNTVGNFVKLANQKFYDGLTWHRVERNFVIQGGCPKGDGTGGPGYNVKAEFNQKPHLKGTVAMARAQDPNSAGSQFYICLAPARFLDRNYTVFGQVVEGQDVVDSISVGDVMTKVTVR